MASRTDVHVTRQRYQRTAKCYEFHADGDWLLGCWACLLRYVTLISTDVITADDVKWPQITGEVWSVYSTWHDWNDERTRAHDKYIYTWMQTRLTELTDLYTTPANTLTWWRLTIASQIMAVQHRAWLTLDNASQRIIFLMPKRFTNR